MLPERSNVGKAGASGLGAAGSVIAPAPGLWLLSSFTLGAAIAVFAAVAEGEWIIAVLAAVLLVIFGWASVRQLRGR